MYQVIFLVIIALSRSTHGSYRYVGCYTHVFHDTLFSSSFMEPTLCFRLCDTPIIYLQKTACRCSGAGLTHHNRQNDAHCSIQCTKPVDRSVTTGNTCGGTQTYSAYVLEHFYTRHGHLFNYQIHFSACELWKTADVYETYKIQLDQYSTKLSLTKLELCAAACLDQNATTKSIAFNDENQCLCMMPWKTLTTFHRSLYITILPNSSCNHFCNNTFSHSHNTDHRFPCGSLSDAHVWAVYDLNGTCPADFVYVKELKKCMYAYKNFWNSCSPPATIFEFDGSVTWTAFLSAINQLQLNGTIVSIDFDESVVIDQAWKCPTTTVSSLDMWSPYASSRSRSSIYSVYRSSTRFLLDGGCLRESSYSSYTHRYSYRLCVADPIDKFAGSVDGNITSSFISAVNPLIRFCPSEWFDLNGRCYRISEERKTIREARDKCIDVPPRPAETTDADSQPWYVGDVMSGDELTDSPSGQIVKYDALWQARLAFFLLDTDPDHDDESDDSTTSTVANLFYEDSILPTKHRENTNHSSINEFQALDNTDDGTNSTNDTCMLITRLTDEEVEKPRLSIKRVLNCTQSKHILCETNTLIVREMQKGCFRKPMTLDPPALISPRLTHELCLSVCQELQTKLAIIQINKCFCLNGASPTPLNLSTNYETKRATSCGRICPGNKNERCGDENTVMVFHILDSRRTFTYARTPAEAFPDFTYDSCLQLNNFNLSTSLQFTIDSKYNFHPRHCLALCASYQQKYALINNPECLCTNIPLKDNQNNVNILSEQNCSQECEANYFYSCGSEIDSRIYSMYIMQPKCRHGFEVAENDQQCVYSHFSAKTKSLSTAQAYCTSIGGVLAKINDIVEIQDILPDFILHTRLMQQLLVYYKFKFINDTRYFWLDRTTDVPDNNTISERILKQCSTIPEIVDRNCLMIQYVPSTDENDKYSHERCITESNDCSARSAMPVCVDQHLEPTPTVIPSLPDDTQQAVSVNISLERWCGDYVTDKDYHFIDDYCYKISFHEVSWERAKLECEQDQAIIFVPEKSVTLQLIKSLFQRRQSYISSGFAHVGVYYESTNRTVIQYHPTEENASITVPDSNAVYDLCEKTYQDRYAALISAGITANERALLKTKKSGCGYIDLVSGSTPVIRCDEIPCNRSATVICQKMPMKINDVVKAKRQSVEILAPDPLTSSYLTSTVSSEGMSSSTILTQSSNTPSDLGIEQDDSIDPSVSRDFAPVFLILGIICLLGMLALFTTLYNRRRLPQVNGRIFHTYHRNTDSVYSQLTSTNDFDLN